MEDSICMEQLPKEGKKLEDALSEGKLVVVRTGDNFLYFLEHGDTYRMFTHSAGQPQAGRRVQAKDSRSSDMFQQLAQEVDSAFSVSFDPKMDIPDVLYSAEEAILETFPMKGNGGKIDFTASAESMFPENPPEI